jgi:hypothetical protein
MSSLITPFEISEEFRAFLEQVAISVALLAGMACFHLCSAAPASLAISPCRTVSARK